MCLVLGVTFGDLANASAPTLSLSIVQLTFGVISFIPNFELISISRSRIGRSSLAAVDSVIYSASVV